MARAFHVNIGELVRELEVRQHLLAGEIGHLRTRLRALPQDTRERPFLIQQITAAGAIAGELESLSNLIIGKELE
jgi:hypothetical protein